MDHITDDAACRARALVADPERAVAAGNASRLIAWAILRTHRRNRLAALAVFRHVPPAGAA